MLDDGAVGTDELEAAALEIALAAPAGGGAVGEERLREQRERVGAARGEAARQRFR